MVVEIDKEDIDHLRIIQDAYKQVLSVVRSVIALDDHTNSLYNTYIKLTSDVFDFDKIRIHTYNIHRKFIDYVATYLAEIMQVDICLTDIWNVLIPKEPIAPYDIDDNGVCPADSMTSKQFERAMKKYNEQLDQYYTKLVQTTLSYNDVLNAIRKM